MTRILMILIRQRKNRTNYTLILNLILLKYSLNNMTKINYMQISNFHKNFVITDINLLDDNNTYASKIITEGVVRPVITSRKIEYTEKPVKNFEPMSTGSKNNWLHSLTHEKP